MKDINQEEIKMTIGGGLSITGAILNAIKTLSNHIYDLGQSFGSSLRRIISGKVCNCK